MPHLPPDPSFGGCLAQSKALTAGSLLNVTPFLSYLLPTSIPLACNHTRFAPSIQVVC